MHFLSSWRRPSGRLVFLLCSLFGLAGLALTDSAPSQTAWAAPKQAGKAPKAAKTPDPVVVTATPVPAGPETGPAAYSLQMPTRAMDRAVALLNLAELKLLLPLSYRPASDAAPEGDGLYAHALQVRSYVRKGPQGETWTLTLALASRPDRTLELLVYAGPDAGGGTSLNTDAGQLRAALEALVTSMPAPAPPATADGRLVDPNLGHYVLQLSYMQSDRVLGLLKALGYTTIEYTAQPGENSYDKVYAPSMTGEKQLPIIVKLVDSVKTSLLDPAPNGGQGFSSQSNLGGSYLHSVTSSEPQQRLLIIYDQENPDAFYRLLTLVREQLDRPARQVLIEAQVIEVNSSATTQLGINWNAGENGFEISSQESDAGVQEPLKILLGRPSIQSLLSFKVGLKALMDSGDAEVLSRPSVLVLEDRQARIKVGQEIPVTRDVVVSQGGVSSAIAYMTVGIVLNLRPRINEDGREISMQVETIVSSISATGGTVAQAGDQALFAPAMDNREVQSFVRVSNDTPFIIGGLISTDHSEKVRGVPWLANLPGIGALFRQKSSEKQKKEVIIVLTPHVVATGQDDAVTPVLPKDAELFDSFGPRLFQNSYRVRSTDVFDMSFVQQSHVLKALRSRLEQARDVTPELGHQEPYASILKGGVPGEDILVKRMLWEIVRRSDFGSYIDPEKIIYFAPQAGDNIKVTNLAPQLARIPADKNALVLRYGAPQGGESKNFSPPVGALSYESVKLNALAAELRTLNEASSEGGEVHPALILTRDNGKGSPQEKLRAVLVLKRLLELNPTMPLTIKDFRPGRQVAFPSQEDIQRRFHVLDEDVARLYYEVADYYYAFEQKFNGQYQQIHERLKSE